MSAPPDPLEKTELAHEQGVSLRAVEHWLKKGLPSRSERRRGRDMVVIARADAEAWLAAHRAPPEDHEGRKAALDEAEIRKRELQAAKLELELAIRRGEVLRADEVERGRLERIAALAKGLEALAARLAPRLAGKSEREIAAVIAEEVRALRIEFSGGTEGERPAPIA